MNNIKDRVAIVTGASGGIGRCIVKGLVKEGVKVMMTDIDEKSLHALNLELGENTDYYPGDLTSKEVCNTIANITKERFGDVSILINSVGVAQRKPLLEVNKEEFMKLYDINVYSTLAMVQATCDMLESSKCGEIISIVSSSGVFPHEEQGAYCATKFAQKALNGVLNIELFDKDIRVHNLYPSAVETEMVKIGRPDLSDNVCCKPEELAEIIVFLLTHRNNSVIDDIIVRRYTKRPDEM